MDTIALTGIIPFTYFRGANKPVGSSFLRVNRLVQSRMDFEKWKHGKKYSNLIFQKSYWIEMMEVFDGPMILDLCDPDWIKNGTDIIKIAEKVHAVTCSSESLTKLVKGYFPHKIVTHVPDRLDLMFYPKARSPHHGKATTVVWFGFIHNAYETLPQLARMIKEHNLKLKIIANLPYTNDDEILALEPQCHIFSHDTAYDLIKAADIVLNPKSALSYFKYKSNNKSLISWKLGVPVAHTAEELEQLMDHALRNAQVRQMSSIVETEYDIHKSADQYNEIFKEIRLNHIQFNNI